MRKKQIKQIGILTYAIIVALFVCSSPARAQETSQLGKGDGASVNVVCAPEQPVIHPGETVKVHAWVTDSSGKALDQDTRFTWSASEGVITGNDTANWMLGSDFVIADKQVITDEQKTITAKVIVTQPSLGDGTCEVHVIAAMLHNDKDTANVLSGPLRYQRGKVIMSGREFLVTEGKEDPGYGLYSYFLFDQPPKDKNERQRYLKAIESFLRGLPPIAELELRAPPSELNLTLLPVKQPIKITANMSEPKEVAIAAEKVLAVYDYAQANKILASICKYAERTGPYLFSRLPAGRTPQKVSLLLNMSSVSPELAHAWITYFRWHSAQERSWSESTLKKLALQMQNVIAVSAKDVPIVLKQMDFIVQLINKETVK